MKSRLLLGILAVFAWWGPGEALVEIPPDIRAALEVPPATSAAAPSFVEGQILLKMKRGSGPEAAAPFVGGRVLREVDDGLFLLEVGRDRVPEALMRLRSLPSVAVAEPNWLRRIHLEPDDTGYLFKWDLNNEGYFGHATPDADMDWEEAYTALGGSCGTEPTLLAVIDTGIDPDHPDLAGKIDTGKARGFVSHYLYGLPPDDPLDENGHGTHVAGIARAATGNATGTVGVGFCEPIAVLPLRVCDWAGSCPDDAIISAINYAVTSGARVINLSLGAPTANPLLEAAVNDAWSAGAVIVASAGNDGTEGISYPAAFAHAIAVGSTNWHDQRAAYSNYGAPDVMAPGGELITYWDEGIYSTLPTYFVFMHYLGYYEEPAGYTWLQGTSMAAPQVSGLAALLLAQDPSLTNAGVRSLLESTTDDLGAAGFDPFYGHGRVNVARAVESLGSEPPPPPDPGDPLAAPSDLTAISGGGGKGNNAEPPYVDLAWSDNADGEEGFDLERCEVVTTGKGRDKSETCAFQPLILVGPDTTAYRDTSVAEGTTYRYRVRAFLGSERSGWSNEAEVKAGGGGGSKGGGPKK